MLKLSLALRLEIGILVTEKGKVAAKLSDGKWLWDLLLLSDISHHLNYLNTKLQGQQELILAVRAFEMNLKLMRRYLKNVNICHFSSYDLLLKDGSVSVPFKIGRAIEKINFLTEKFKLGLGDFCSLAKNIRIFENTFSF
jgi:hypothetical protein